MRVKRFSISIYTHLLCPRAFRTRIISFFNAAIFEIFPVFFFPFIPENASTDNFKSTSEIRLMNHWDLILHRNSDKKWVKISS